MRARRPAWGALAGVLCACAGPAIGTGSGNGSAIGDGPDPAAAAQGEVRGEAVADAATVKASRPDAEAPPFDDLLDAALGGPVPLPGGIRAELRALEAAAGQLPVLVTDDLGLERLAAVLALAEALPDHGIAAPTELRDAHAEAAVLYESLWAAEGWTGDAGADRERARLLVHAEHALLRLWLEVARALDATRPHPGELPARQETRLTRALAQWMAPRALASSLLPSVAAYEALTRAYGRYRAMGAFVEVPPAVRKARPGQAHPAILALRARLAQEDPTVPAEGEALWDEPLTAALTRAREAFSLPPRPKPGLLLDAPLLTALARPLPERLAILELNLRRWRQSALADFPYAVFVNLPDYHGEVQLGDEVLRRFKVVIGGRARENRTPTLAAYIHQVIYNPYWNVPERIFKDELLAEAGTAAGATDPLEYLKGRGYELMGGDDPAKQWIRRRPGPGNALGKVKLVFENRYFVFMHDTPTKQAFNEVRRTLSHGCMRVHEPLALAELLLRRDGTWSEAEKRQVFEHFRETPIDLHHPVPIVVEYLTARVTEDGRLLWLEDVYGRDREALPALAGR